jgi:uncharacterized protein
MEIRSRPLVARSGVVDLAGTHWEPDGVPAATVVMHPGSGPSDRNNDQYFPEIRHHLLSAGIAVAAFDKRGVGESTGRWEDAGIVEQAADMIAILDRLSAEDVPGPVGLFGHSQGGWVVLEAVGQGAPADFIITNSGPGMSPAIQDRFALGSLARRNGHSDGDVKRVLDAYDATCEHMRRGASLAEARAKYAVLSASADPLLLDVMPTSDEEWRFARAILDYDPRLAMSRVQVPVLALFGADDDMVPVAESVAVFRDEVRADLLTVAVLDGGDHRLQTGNPKRLVDGYSAALMDFVTASTASWTAP